MDVVPNRSYLTLDSVSVALCAVDGAGNIRHTNRALDRLLGWQPREREGQSLAGYLLEAIADPAQALAWTVALSEAVSQGKTVHLNLPTRLCPGPGRQELANITGVVIAVNHGQGSAPGAIVALYGPEVLDNTEAVRTRLFSAMSHELGSPMTNIVAAAELLASRPDLQDERQRRLVGIIRDEVARLQRLMAQFVAPPPAERPTTPARNMVTLRPLLRRVIQAFGLQERGRNMIVRLPADLPFVWGDADAIQQVLSNLVDNALHRTPAGTPIALEVDAAPNEVRICVVDRGPAVPLGQQHLLQASPAPRDVDGGSLTHRLGLSISLSLVEGMGGNLWYQESGPGQHSFCFTLPCAHGEPAEQQAEEV